MPTLALIPEEALIKQIGSAYAGAAQRIVAVLRELDPATYTVQAGMAALGRVRRIVDELDARASDWASRAVKSAYGESRRIATTRLEVIGASKPKPKRGTSPAEAKAAAEKPHDRAIAKFTRLAARDYIAANRTILTTAGKYMSMLQLSRRKVDSRIQAEMQAFDPKTVRSWIDDTVVKAVKAQEARSDVYAKIRDKLLDVLKGSNFIRINGRDYDLRGYSELVAGVRMREAASEATLESAAEYGHDLVEIPGTLDPCDDCADIQDKVYSVSGDDPDYPALTEDTTPPIHPRCVLPGTRCISPGGIIAGQRAMYWGEAIKLTFANGASISITPNHMLLTPNGFASADLLREGDDVFYCPGFERIVPVDPNGDYFPTLIEDVIGALAKASGMTIARVPVSPEYLHGDGRFCDGNIDVIWPDRLLRDAREAAPLELLPHPDFGGADVRLFDFPGSGNLAAVLHRLALSADGVVGGPRASSSYFCGRAGGGNSIGLSRCSLDESVGQNQVLQSSVNDLVADAEMLCQIAFEIPGLIETHKLVHVDRFFYHGFVYDLQSSTSLYVGNGLVSSNCRHYLRIVSKEILSRRAS
jgi:hypothetical protein